MKIAIAGGHSKKAGGAVGLINEHTCDRAYVAQLIAALRKAGHTVVDCSNEKATQSAELAEECRLANASGADLFIAVHFNAGGGTGTECWYHDGSAKGKSYAAKMSANVAEALGIRDRGAKASSGLYVLKHTSMTAVLLEVCFVDNAIDARAWRGTSWGALTEAVVDAVGSAKAQWVKDPKGWWWRNADGTYPKSSWKKIAGAWYWFDSRGYAACSEWVKIDGYWYWFDASCAAATGWAKVNGAWYYLRPNDNTPAKGPQCAMLADGTWTIGGKAYSFDSSGKCLNP